ncbi:MAG: diguanylate cyclase [Anaerolineales bacterium]|nr:diguanylate cyclase [Anaerolineales bacterium]
MQKIFKFPPLDGGKRVVNRLRLIAWVCTAGAFITMLVSIVVFFNSGDGGLITWLAIISFVILLITNYLLSNLQRKQREIENNLSTKNGNLDKSEPKLRTIIESIPFDMWISDKEHRYILQSGESIRLGGNIIDKTPDQLGQPAEIVEQWKVNNQRALDGETVYQEESRVVDNEQRYFMTIKAPVNDETSFKGYIGIHLDITQRKSLEKKMQHSADQLAMLNDIGRAITTLGDVDSVLNLIREQVQQILPVDAFIVLLYEPETKIVSFPLVYDNGRNWSEPDREISMDMKSDDVLKTGKSLLVNLTVEEFEEIIKNPNRSLTGDYSTYYRSFIYSPLVRQDKVIGVVSAVSYDYNTYTEEHLKLLDGVAIQATIAIENARLYQAQQKELSDRKLAEQEILKLNAELERRVANRTIQLQEANENLNNEKAHLEQYNRQRDIMATMTGLLQASLTVNEASEIVSTHLKLLFPDCDGAVYLLNPSGLLEPSAVWGESESLNVTYTVNECWALRRGKTYRFGAHMPNPACAHVEKNIPSHALCIPLSAQNENLGNIHIASKNNQDIELILTEEQNFIEDIANSFALALGNLRLRERLHSLSIRDALTGLFNRRYLDETLPREINRAERKKSQVGILFFDIDNFKKFNDTYGHDAGDLVLKTMSEVIISIIRESDVACRYGGEEFIIILPDTSIEIAEQRAETLRNKVSLMKLDHNGQDIGKVTISIGVASYPQHGETRDTLIKSADIAAYLAKTGGRNQVVVSK